MKFGFSNDVQMAVTYAQSLAAQNYHQSVTTAHIYLGINKMLKAYSERNGEPYTGYREKIKKIQTENGVTGDKLKEAFFTMFPVGEEPEFNEKRNITQGMDLQKVQEQLKRLAISNKRDVTLVDLIHEIFSDMTYDLHQMFQLAYDAMTADKVCEQMKEEFKIAVPRIESIEELDECQELTNLNKWVKEHDMVFVDPEPIVNQIRLALSCKNINCAMLVGKAGTGKTAAVYAFIDAINKGQCEGFNDKIVYQLDMSQCVAGSIYRGAFEQKLLNIINAVKAHNDKVILFIDEAHTIIGSGSSSEGSMDGANILKPFITRGELTIIGATTDEEYHKSIEKDPAFKRRFHKLHVSEPTKEQVKKILTGLRESFEKHFNKKFSEEVIDKIIDLSLKYSVGEANPARSINMLDLACAHSKVFTPDNSLVIDDNAMSAIEIQYNIHATKTPAEDTKEAMDGYILGQDEVLKRINENLKSVELGLCDPEKPLMSMLFGGSTGVGKTEVCKVIAKNFFGSEKNLIKINLGEYGNEMDVNKLSGSAPGYVGSEDEGDLVKSVKQYPRSLVLFDEMEKCHPKVLDILLNILDTGEMKSNKGELISFRNCIIVFTTNLGYKAGHSEEKGLGFVKKSTSTEDIMNAIKKELRPEFINRIDDIIIFNSLTNEIADTLIERYKKDFEEYSGLSFKLSAEDMEAIKKEANIKEYGARGLKRAVRKQLLLVGPASEEEKEYTREELVEMAKSAGVKGASRMKKDELKTALKL